jgi:acetyl esterase/lipase
MDLEFSALPPCYLSAGTADPLCESTEIFSKRIADSSNEVVTDIFEDQPHGFFNFSSRPASQEMRANILAFIARNDSKSS